MIISSDMEISVPFAATHLTPMGCWLAHALNTPCILQTIWRAYTKLCIQTQNYTCTHKTTHTHTKRHNHTQNYTNTHKTISTHTILHMHTQNYTYKTKHTHTNHTLITTPISGEVIWNKHFHYRIWCPINHCRQTDLFSNRVKRHWSEKFFTKNIPVI